jgi:hypothetical protein
MRCGILVALAALAPMHTGAQATTATLHGVVLSAGERTPLAAWIDVRNRESGETRRALTDSKGAYRILGLSPGTHDVVATSLGYRPQRRVNVQLVLGERSRADFTLERAVVELEPALITAAATLEVDRLNVSTPVLQREIERLPLNSRNVLGLAAIAPGSRSFGTEAGRAMPTSGPIPGARFVNMYVDGVEWKSMGTGQLVGIPASGSLLPQESIREFRVYQNPYDAEFSRGASWVVSAVTQQGGNVLHGSMFGFDQGRALVARGAFQREKPDYQRLQLGGNLRGPIVRDRLFFAASYESQATDNYIDVVPGRPVASPEIWDRYAGTFAAPFRNQMATVRLTGLAGAHTLDAIWIGRTLTNESSFGVRQGGVMLSHAAGTTSSYGVSSLQLRDKFAARALLNELSLHLLANDQVDSPLQPGPTLRYPGIQFGRTSYPLTITERQAGLTDRLSLAPRVFGQDHLLKLGVELTRVYGSAYQPTSRDGFFSFSTDTSSVPASAQIGIGFVDPTSTDDARDPRASWLVGAFVQDQWKPVASVTLMAGIRYDAELGTLNQGNVAPWASDTVLQRVVSDRYLNAGDRTNDLDNIAPRLAVAWDVTRDGNTVLRAGYGVMYDRIPVQGAFSEEIAWRWRIYVIQNPGTTDPEVLRQRVIAAGTASAPSLVLLPDRLQTPSNEQWSVGVGRRMTDRVALNVDYVHQRLSHLPVTVRANVVNTVTRKRPLTNRYGDLVLWGDFGAARYGGVLSSLTYDHANTRLSVAYTLSWSESRFGTSSTPDYPDSASYTMQASEADERHRVVLSGLTDLPRHFELAVITIAASPHPYPIVEGTDVNHDGVLTDDFPDGMRTARRDGFENWYRTIDLRLGRRFSLARTSLVVTAEVFNVANWANHSEYQGTRSLLGYGSAVGDYARRQGQLGMRVEF